MLKLFDVAQCSPNMNESEALTKGLMSLTGGTLGAKFAHDAFSPTIKLWGISAAGFVKRAAKNVSTVIKKRDKILAARGKKGGVSFRTGIAALENAATCEDGLQAAYLGGILASASSKNPRDDMAVSYMAIVNSLSRYQLRTHALVYGSLLQISNIEFERAKEKIFCGDVTILIAADAYREAMKFNENEDDMVIAPHAFNGLAQQGLLKGGNRICRHALPTNLSPSSPLVYPVTNAKPISKPFRYIYPTPIGIELFAWGMGLGDLGSNGFGPSLKRKVKLPINVKPTHVIWGHTTFA